jgi:hypothetical protein
MAERPAVNSNVDDIADRAKHGYATGTKLLAEAQYRLAELAGTDRLDPDESMSLQHNLVSIWEALYFGTVYAVRDQDSDESAWAPSPSRNRLCSQLHSKVSHGSGANGSPARRPTSSRLRPVYHLARLEDL